jgi:nucleoside-diphosphate-sugar epimerase
MSASRPRPELRRRSLLVTGAGGFIGSRLVRALLDDEADVHAIVRPGGARDRLADARGAAVHEVDLSDLDGLERTVRSVRPELVLHAAFPFGHPSSRAERLRMVHDGVLGTFNVLEAVSAAGAARVVHFGSTLEYGPRSVPLAESEPLTPSTWRGGAKAASALLALQTARSLGVELIVLRPFSVYGPWESPRRLIPTLVRAALTGEEVSLVPGPRHDFVFVDDVVEAALGALTAPLPNGEAFNLGTGIERRNEEVAALVEDVCSVRLRIHLEHPGSPADAEHWVADVEKSVRLLGWRARTSLRDGLAKTVEWQRARD